MNLPKVITVAWLEFVGACEKEVEVFAGEWPGGVEVTKDNVIRAVDLGLDVGWLIRCFASYPFACRWTPVSYGSAEEKAELFVEAWYAQKRRGPCLK